ncbi:type VII secretion protein EccE [Mycolicibacterium conceptionense]|uniref:type VII secretion protein EccE n=1 Tax=Mycolicibacterium conceptionense TaxID=451644 RepID=UPI0009BA7735|nr:type VII secretion protein EccE [Mycolicibacterium conceptionense]
MARRRGNETTDRPESTPDDTHVEKYRTAVPSRELVRFNPRSGLIASALGTAAVLGSASTIPAAGAAGAAVIAVGIGGAVRGRTLSEWASLRRASRVLPEQAALYPRDGVGVIFDGRTVTALIEITPRPWQITCIGPTGISESPVISADVLRRQLRQYDIGLSRIEVICAGYKFAARDDAAGVLDTLIGPVSVPLGGTTVIAVSIDLEADILIPAYARARRNSLPDGLGQVLTVAATRVKNSLAEQGFGGRLMSAQQVRDFHDTVLAQVAKPLGKPGWNTCGPSNGVHTRTYVPARGHWNAESAGSWNHLQAHRQYTTLTLTPQGEGVALAQPLITYLVRGGDALAKAESYGLRTAGGQQAVGLNRALPVSTRLPLRSTGALIDDHRRLGFGISAGGAGLFVGTREDKTRVFVAVSPAEEPLWLAGNTLFAMQMVARLSTQDQRIAVMIDEPHWQQLVAHRDTPALTLGTADRSPADVIVCTPAWWERHRSLTAGKAVLLVTEDAPGRGATNSLTASTVDGRWEITVNADTQSTRLLWELTQMERRVLLGGIDPTGSTAAPRVGDALSLMDVVSVPAAEVAPSAPAPAVPAPELPEVPTVGIMSFPDTPAEPVSPTPAPFLDQPTEVLPRVADPVEETAQLPRIADEGAHTQELPRVDADSPLEVPQLDTVTWTSPPVEANDGDVTPSRSPRRGQHSAGRHHMPPEKGGE